MAWSHRFGMLLILLSLVFRSSCVSSNENDYIQCESIVRNWADSSRETGTPNNKLNLKDLLFFLHVPRTGGRTYFYCLLKKLYAKDQECPSSYDILRFDPSKPNCRLVITHDDYSLMSKLPKERTSVVTILRNPINRVFSAYEFSVEVAARFLVHPNLTSAVQMSGRIRPKSRGVSTLDIWPWKYLVPWMREDLFGRRDDRKLGKFRRIQENNDPYNMENMVMPLHEFINDPLAHEIIHNGATFQVAGITNNSYLEESHNVRHCVKKHPSLGRYVLEIAKSRLDHMLYVGLTEDHKESATMFVNMVGAQVLSQTVSSSSNDKPVAFENTDSVDDTSNLVQRSSDDHEAGEVTSPTDVESEKGNMTVEKLMKTYAKCTPSLRKTQAKRRTMSLKRIAPANFSKEARQQVPEEVLQQIISLNSLDVELYEHARNIFVQQQKHLMQNGLEGFMQQQQGQLMEWQVIGSNVYGSSPWHLILFVTAVSLSIVLLFVLVRRRTTSKIKV